MKKGKVKLLSAAIMLSGLLAVSPAVADEETFPIVIDNKDKGLITGGGYNNKTLESSIYKVIDNDVPTSYDDYVLLQLNPDKFDQTKNIFENNKNTKGNGSVISAEGYASVQIGDLNYEPAPTSEHLYYNFINNSAFGNGGVIYIDAKGDEIWNDSAISRTNFSGNQAQNGGAIYVNGDSKVGLWVNKSEFSNNSAIENGGAIYFTVANSINGEIAVTDTSFIGNSAKQGSAIYASAVLSIDAEDKDVLFDNQKGRYGIYLYGKGITAELLADKDKKITINDDIYIENETLSMAEIKQVVNNVGVENLNPYNFGKKLAEAFSEEKPELFDDESYIGSIIASGIYLDGSSVYYHQIGPDPDPSTWEVVRYKETGTYELNGKIDLSSTSGLKGFQISTEADGGTLKLGQTPATGTYSFLLGGDDNNPQYDTPIDFTVDLQNNHAGDILNIPYLVSTNKESLLNFKFDYDAKNSIVDNIIINNIGDEFMTVSAPSVKFDLNNIVIFDDENWIDGSTRTIRYLTDNSGNVIDLTENGSYAFDDGTVYSFTVMKENKGTANVLREEKYISLEEAIADATTNGYTLRSGDYKLSDDSKGLGTISSEKTIFAINGNNNSLDGSGKDGITVATADQTLNINDVKEFKNFKTAVTNQSGIVNINNSTFIDNEIDLVNEKTTNITNSTLNGVVQNNNGTINLTDSSIKNTVTNNAELNIYGDSTIQNIIGTGTVAIGDESKEANVIFGKDNSIKQSQVTINGKGSLEIYADKLESKNGVVNNNKLTLKAQEATEETPETINKNTITGYGTTVIDGGVINTEKSIGSKNILVNENATLKANADNVGITGTTEKVTNNGTVSLNGGTLGILIDGGKIALTGDVTSSADNLFGDITNDGKLTLTTGTLKKDIAESETGSVLITDYKSVVNEANINQLITVDGAAYETSADRIYDKDDAIKALNGSEIVLNGGTLKENRIIGEDASVYIKNKVTFDFDNSKYDANHILSNIDIDETGVFRPADTYTGENNTILFYNGSTIDLANGQVNTVKLKDLEANQAGDKLFILADYGDYFDAEDKLWFDETNVIIKSLDLSNMQENDKESYQFTTNLKDYVKMELEEIKFSENTDKNSVYYVKDDGKIYVEKLDNLEQAIQKVQDNSTNLVYQMSQNENLSENKAIKNGDMTILGQGNSIEGKALTVGNGTDERKLILSDTNLKNIDLNDSEKYSLIVKDKAMIQITAKDNDVAVTGNINLEKDDNSTNSGKYKLVFNAADGKTITLGDGNGGGDIISDVFEDTTDPDNPVKKYNTVTFKGQGGNSNIVANGIFDPFVANVDNVNLTRNNYDDEITYNLNDGGVLKYNNDLYLYDLSKHDGTTYNKNSINFQGGTLNLANGSVNDIQLKSLVLGIDNATLQIAKTSYINVDVDLANKKMDTLNAETVKVIDGSKLNLDMNVISDASSEITAGVKFTDSDDLWTAVNVDENKEYTAESSIYKYTVKKGGATANDGFTFARKGGYEGFNSAVFAPAVAMQGIYYSQINNYDTAFGNVDQMMLKTKAQRNAEKYGNKYAYDGDETQVFSPLYTQLEDKGVWFRPYVSTEKVNLKDGPKVNNTMYGALIGGDSFVMPVKGWDVQYSAYVGYNGSSQSFDGNDITQNGGVVGVTASAYKGDFFTALTANASFHSSDIKTNLGDADVCTLGAGIASKTGYNWELADGKFIIQPSWLMSYTFVNPFCDYNVGGVKVKSDSLNAIQLAPGLKFIGNTETGWQPYIGAKMVWNIIDETKVKANEVNLPETSTKAYVEYGLGVQKSVGERFTGFGQAMFRGGGRNGVAFTLGTRWSLGSLAYEKKDKN